MNWLDKTPTELFKTIPQEILDNLVVEKQQKVFSTESSAMLKILITNQLMARHILSKHNLPHFIINQESLIRWLFCIYVIE